VAPQQQALSRTISHQRQQARSIVTTNPWAYELRPSHDLPIVDLSVSIKSRFLGPRMLTIFTTMVSYRRTMLVGALLALVLCPIALVIDTRLGRPIAVVSSLASLPLTLAAVSLLRYEVVKLLLWTYDAQLFLWMSVTTVAASAAFFQDARSMLPIVSLFGLLPNIFIDANLRAVQVSTMVTGLHIISMVISTVELVIDIVPDVQTDMALAWYGKHALPAKMYVTNGLITLTVLLLRNFYRKREAVFRRGNPALQHCVTYHAKLKLCPAPDNRSSKRSTRRLGAGESSKANAGDANKGNSREELARSTDAISVFDACIGPPVSIIPTPTCLNVASRYVQQLRYDQAYRVIDVRNTVWPTAFTFMMGLNRRITGVLFHTLAMAAFIAFVLALPLDLWLLADDTGVPKAECTALALTLALNCFVLGLAQRDLLRAVVFSFDFAYLSLHLVFLCWCMCDFFRWNRHSIMVLIVCLWLHGPMLVDAITPPIRARLRYQARGFALGLTLVALGSTAVAAYVLIFDPVMSASVNDRVVWTAHVPGAAVVQVTMPYFYSCWLTAFLMMLRFLYRAATYGNDDLIFIDGPVVFTNCFHRRTIIAAATTTPDIARYRSEMPSYRIEPRQPSLIRSPVVPAEVPKRTLATQDE